MGCDSNPPRPIDYFDQRFIRKLDCVQGAGRPITREEFERMLAKVPDVLGQDRAKSWTHLLEGLWWSGPRLGEALELHWTDDERLCVDLFQALPMLRIPAELEKGNRVRLLPMASEFGEMLLETPEHKRTGYVFSPKPQRVASRRLSMERVSRIISRIGKSAGSIVDHRKGEPVFASAHDLRRSFGERRADDVMPKKLMELMRHESIDTTMRYYVGRNAQKTCADLWAIYKKRRGHLPNQTPNQPKAELT